MKLLFENWRRFINEVEFFDSPDEDVPGKKQIIVFAEDEVYDISGKTHGSVSHTIKHYIEFDPQGVATNLKQALNKAKQFDNFFLKNTKSGQVTASGDEAKKAANEYAMLNTFDMINDKLQNNQPLKDEEKQLIPIISGLNKEYQNLIDSYMSSAIDIENVQDVEKIKQILSAGKIVKFVGSFKGTSFQYFLNASNTGLVASTSGKVATLFRIDKRGNDLSKVEGYFKRGVELKNSAFAEALASYGGGSAAQPQQPQAQAKQKSQQKKKGPNIKAMAMGMQRGGKSFEDIQAQIKKTTGRDISVDNIKRMISAR